MRSTDPRRFISPSGFLLVILCLFLPFLTVSCETDLGSTHVTYSGIDLVFNTAPEVSGVGAGDITEAEIDDMRPGHSPLALAAMASLLAGIGLGAGLPGAFGRWLAGATAGAVALLMAIANQISALREGEAEAAVIAGTEAEPNDAIENLIETQSEPGFWIAVVFLVALTAYNTAGLVLVDKTRRQSAGPQSAPDPPAGLQYPPPSGGPPAGPPPAPPRSPHADPPPGGPPPG